MKPQETTKKFIKKEWKQWNSFQSRFIRVPDSLKKEIADWWLAELLSELQAHTDRVVEAMEKTKKKINSPIKYDWEKQDVSFNQTIDTSIQIAKNTK